MPYYRIAGEVPRKRHIRFRGPAGNLYAEELMGEEGFVSDSSLLYHEHPPTGIVKSEGLADAPGEATLVPNHPLLPRHFRTQDLPAGGDLVIVDSPALERDASAGLTAGVTDAVILVVRAGPNAPDQVGAGLRVLHKYNTAVLGTVLTMADEAVNSDMQSREPGSYPMSQAAPPAAQP